MKINIFTILGVLLLVNAIVLVFISNIHVGHILYLFISLGLIGYSLVAHNFTKLLNRMAVTMFFIPIVFAIFLAVYGNISSVTHDEDVLIVLGAGLNGYEVSPHLARRLTRAIEYFEQNPDVTIIVCGGLGEQQSVTEAFAMTEFLMYHGVPRDSIIKEDLSTSTYENLIFAQEMLEEVFPNGFTSVLITNDFHIFRATNIARSIGLDVVPLGASTPWYSIVPNYLREMIAVVGTIF